MGRLRRTGSALYADDKVVSLICDDLLYVKILPASRELEPLCEKGEPYPGARPHYVVEEAQLSALQTLPRDSVRHRRVSAGQEKKRVKTNESKVT